MNLKTILISILFMFAFVFTDVNAQDSFTPRQGTSFDVSSGTLTNETITVVTKTFDVYTTSTGSLYIIAHSEKKNKDYPIWIGTLTDEVYQGLPVRVSKNGTKFLLELTEEGQPRYVWDNKTRVK